MNDVWKEWSPCKNSGGAAGVSLELIPSVRGVSHLKIQLYPVSIDPHSSHASDHPISSIELRNNQPSKAGRVPAQFRLQINRLLPNSTRDGSNKANGDLGQVDSEITLR